MSRASVIATLVGGFLSILSSGCGNTAAAPPPIGVSLSKGSATVEVGTTAQFSATVTKRPGERRRELDRLVYCATLWKRLANTYGQWGSDYVYATRFAGRPTHGEPHCSVGK